MESSWKKPETKMVKNRPQPHPTSEEAKDQRDEMELAAAQAKIAQQVKENEDKIGKIIGGEWFITNWTDPILVHPTLKSQMTVTRYYPNVGVAVDIFTHVSGWEQSLIALKRQAFKDHEAHYGGQAVKVKYGALSYSDSLAALLPQLES